jgi:hypothetical protein
MRFWTGAAMALVVASQVDAQSVESGRAGPRGVLPREREIALARSAAPAAVSDDARVLVWNGADFEAAVEGANGVTCYVARSWPESLEPHCFDEEGSATILPIHVLQMKLWDSGAAPEAVDAAIARGLRTGELRLPSRPVMSYMMSAGQRLIDDDGQSVGAWQPHLMIYYPYLTQEALGLGAPPSTDAAIVVDPGTPLSNIMVVVKDFAPGSREAPSGR